MDLKSKIILISGPTASGKSSFAIKFAKKVNGEIINADSMQIYKEFSILSSRPNNKEIKKLIKNLATTTESTIVGMDTVSPVVTVTSKSIRESIKK